MKTVLVRRDQNHVSFCFFSNFDEKGIFLLLPRGFLFFCFFFAEPTCSGKLSSFVSRRISGNFSASIFLAACICPLRDAIRVASSVEQTGLSNPHHGIGWGWAAGDYHSGWNHLVLRIGFWALCAGCWTPEYDCRRDSISTKESHAGRDQCIRSVVR